MSAYVMSLWALALALISQSLATGWATEVFVRKDLAAGLRRSWMVMAVAAMLLALFHGYTLELASRLISKPTPTASGRGDNAASVRSK